MLRERRRPEASVSGRDQNAPVDQGVHEGERMGSCVKQTEGESPDAARRSSWGREGVDEPDPDTMCAVALGVDGHLLREEMMHGRPHL